MNVPALSKYTQGLNVVSGDELNTFVQGGAIASQLRGIVGLPGMTIMLSGISYPNDGSGGFFYWNAGGNAADDNYTYIVPYGDSSGLWQRLTLPGAPPIRVPTTAIISAAGTTPGTATPLTAQFNVVTSVAANSGVILRVLSGVPTIKVLNRGSNPLNVYPPNGSQIELLGTNNPAGIYMNGGNFYTTTGTTQWYES